MKREKIKVQVPIPDARGKKITRTVETQVWADFDETIGDYILDGEALNKIERVKAREMGIMLPEDIKRLRQRLGLRQKDICQLLQIGEKTWSRWENERERPSRSMNILLHALNDGRLNIPYLKNVLDPFSVWSNVLPICQDSKQRKFSRISVEEEKQPVELEQKLLRQEVA